MDKETVRPHLEYGSTAWSATANTNQLDPDRVQNQALRLITGAMRSTPITEMERLTGAQPLGQRRDAKNMMQAEKFKCMTYNHMKTKLEGLTNNRLKRSSFVHESKKLNRQFHDRLPPEHTPLLPDKHVRVDICGQVILFTTPDSNVNVCLLAAQCPSNMLVYLRDGSAQTTVPAATLR